jgi:acyl-coenzyme A thioesterase PaaI-like protein
MDRIQAIFRNDRLIQDFGMTLVEAREGYAKVSVAVAERFLNAHRIGHGVLLFAVADAAFASGPGRRNRVRRGQGHPCGPPIPGVRTHRDGRRR